MTGDASVARQQGARIPDPKLESFVPSRESRLLICIARSPTRPCYQAACKRCAAATLIACVQIYKILASFVCGRTVDFFSATSSRVSAPAAVRHSRCAKLFFFFF